jgi:hypothetical protein
MSKLSSPSPGFRFRINAKLFLPFARAGFGCLRGILVSHILRWETNTLCTIRTNLDGMTSLHLTQVFFPQYFFNLENRRLASITRINSFLHNFVVFCTLIHMWRCRINCSYYSYMKKNRKETNKDLWIEFSKFKMGQRYF